MKQLKSASEELLELSKELMEEFRSIKRAKDDDDFDAGYKEGERNAMLKVNDLIFKRVEMLLKKE